MLQRRATESHMLVRPLAGMLAFFLCVTVDENARAGRANRKGWLLGMGAQNGQAGDWELRKPLQDASEANGCLAALTQTRSDVRT